MSKNTVGGEFAFLPTLKGLGIQQTIFMSNDTFKNQTLSPYIDIKLQNEQGAVHIALKKLASLGYKWNDLRYLNQKRYCIAFGNPPIAILYKTELFNNFGKKFAELGKSGLGDSINCKDIREFIRCNVERIYLILPDRKLYCIPMITFLKHTTDTKWINKEGKEVRSISIHKYKRIINNLRGD